MLLVTVSVPALSIPPPEPVAVLELNVLPTTVSVPVISFSTAPPDAPALPVTAKLVSVSVPALSMPPPFKTASPSVIVRSEIEAVVPGATEKTWIAAWPLIESARAGAVDHLRTNRFTQGQRAGQVDRLWCRQIEDRRVELDLATRITRVGVGLRDAVKQIARHARPRARIGRGVDRVNRGRNCQQDPVLKPFPHPLAATLRARLLGA